MSTDKRLMTTASAAKELGVCDERVRQLEASGALGCTRTQSGQRLFAAEDVAALAGKRAAARAELKAKRCIHARAGRASSCSACIEAAGLLDTPVKVVTGADIAERVAADRPDGRRPSARGQGRGRKEPTS